MKGTVVMSVAVTPPVNCVSPHQASGLGWACEDRECRFPQTWGVQPGIHLWEALTRWVRSPQAGLKGDTWGSRRQWVLGDCGGLWPWTVTGEPRPLVGKGWCKITPQWVPDSDMKNNFPPSWPQTMNHLPR